jgi:hypothetical protein
MKFLSHLPSGVFSLVEESMWGKKSNRMVRPQCREKKSCKAAQMNPGLSSNGNLLDFGRVCKNSEVGRELGIFFFETDHKFETYDPLASAS